MKRDMANFMNDYAETWSLLDRYDRGAENTLTELDCKPGKFKYEKALKIFRESLFSNGWAPYSTTLMQERIPEHLKGLISNIFQTFDGTDCYPSVEEKAARLLYFIVKNHPFVDGNKRAGAYLFMHFLACYDIDASRLDPQTLFVLTVTVASSQPEEEQAIIQLILGLITQEDA